MIIYPDNNIEKQSHRPNENWSGREDVITVDNNSELALKIEQHSPFFERVLDEGGNLIDITPTERPPEPPPQPTEIDILGQQLVEKDLQILDLQNENQALGQQLVDIDLRLLAGGL